MQRYILGKSIENNKANKVKNLESIGKAIQEFISAIYEAHWDNLFVDNNKTTFRNKVKSKFNPQITRPQVNNKEKETAKPIFISSLSLPILAKLQKEVNEISKYFKKSDKPPQKKSYTQASSQFKLAKSISSSSVAMDMLKIKEMFPNFPNRKINMVQKVINSDNGKPEPRINMTTKSPSYK